jgi:hypothetical protein
MENNSVFGANTGILAVNTLFLINDLLELIIKTGFIFFNIVKILFLSEANYRRKESYKK